MQVLPKRSEVPLEETWDLTALFSTAEEWAQERDAVVFDCRAFHQRYAGTIRGEHEFLRTFLAEWEQLQIRLQRVYSYASLAIEVDRTDPQLQEQMGKMQIAWTESRQALNFADSEILALPEELLEEMSTADPLHAAVWKRFKHEKIHRLSPEAESLLVALSPALNLPDEAYSTAKMADLRFPDFACGSKTFPMDFVRFENDYQYEQNTELRRAAFTAFSNQLRTMGNTFATLYSAQVQTEKAIATARGYDSVFDYLLDMQEVDRKAYERQIDGIYKGLAPIMRRYVQLLQRVHGWDRLTHADLKVPLDCSEGARFSLQEAQDCVSAALQCMGNDYAGVVDRALREHWIDFAHNEGKSTGGFCASIYGSHSWILMTWNGLLSEVYTLVHELGHALHSYHAMRAQPFFQHELSMYLVEAPSTFHELLLSRHRLQLAQTPDETRRILADLIANTYYHNFVTHLLEAHYQRKVYEAVDRGEVLHFTRLNQMMEETLRGFWGDVVEWTPGAELTWMRQPHYYYGLYSYTYSAGLTLATRMYQRLETEGDIALEQWKQFLRAGGSARPLDLAKQILGIDLSSDEPLQKTLEWLDEIVTQMEHLTDEAEKEK